MVAAEAVDAKSLLTLASEAWPPGSRRRQVVLQHLAAMCRWAVESDLLPADRWTPPPSLRSFVGEGAPARADGVPITDGEILNLLQHLALGRGEIPQRTVEMLLQIRRSDDPQTGPTHGYPSKFP